MPLPVPRTGNPYVDAANGVTPPPEGDDARPGITTDSAAPASTAGFGKTEGVSEKKATPKPRKAPAKKAS